MIQSDIELQATQERIARFQQQLVHLRKVETNPTAFFWWSGYLPGRLEAPSQSPPWRGNWPDER